MCKGTWHRHANAFAASPWCLQLQWPRKAHTTSHLKSCQQLLKFLPKVPPSSTSILSLVLNYTCYFTSLTKSLLSTQLKSKAQRQQLWPTSLLTSPNCPETCVISTPLLQVFSILHWGQDRQRQGEQACLTFCSFPLQFNCPWSQKKGKEEKRDSTQNCTIGRSRTVSQKVTEKEYHS